MDIPAQSINGTLAYLAQGWDGGETSSYTAVVLRSLGGLRLLPVRHLGPPGANLQSNIATYGFHEGEFGTGNPQFSPDGHVLLYEESGPMPRYGSGALFEWDMVAARVRQLTPRSIAYGGFFWSPDSQSIAYVSGGEESRRPEQLCIVSRRMHGTQTIVLPQGVSLLLTSPSKQQSLYSAPIAWASPTALLFTGLPAAGADKTAALHPNIYQTTAGKAQLAVPNAYAPNPSPDGRWIAGFGWPEAESAELKTPSPQEGPNLYLFDRRNHKRFFVRALPHIGRREAENGEVPPSQILRWTPDSRRLIISEETYATQGQTGTATATFSALDVPSPPLPADTHWAQNLRLITTLHLTDFTADPAIHFGILQMSADGSHLFMATRQTTGQKGEQTLSESALQRIDLQSGQTEVLARFNTDRLLGFDWHEEPK